MNDQNIAVRMNTSEDIEQTDQVGNALGAGLEEDLVLADKAVVDESLPDGNIPSNVTGGDVAALPNSDESEHFRTLWNEIQGKFVDEPRAAVQHADTLVSELIEKITQQFANEHSSLERQWKDSMDASTEDLRQAFQRYRSFFNRLGN